MQMQPRNVVVRGHRNPRVSNIRHVDRTWSVRWFNPASLMNFESNGETLQVHEDWLIRVLVLMCMKTTGGNMDMDPCRKLRTPCSS